jgi:dephospho-CoA kinase
LDADHLAHQSYQDPKIQETLRKEFGDEIFRSGRIDRKKLLSLVAENKEKRLLLNRLIHPYVFQKTQEAIDHGKYKKIVVDMPLLIGSPIENECDLIIAVIADQKTREKRLQSRGVDVEKSLALNRDFPLGALKKAAGIILDGSGDLANLRKQLDSYPFL